MRTASPRRLVARTFRVVTRTSRVVTRTSSMLLLSFSTAVTAAAAGSESVPLVPHVDRCSEATLTGNAGTAHCDAVIHALSERELNADQSWQLAAALNNRALSRNRAQDTEGAIGDLTLAIDIMPRWAELYVNRGNLYLKTAAHAAALADYEQALLLSGGRLDAVLFNRAFVQRALGQPKRAEAELLLWQAAGLPPAAPDATEETVEPVSGGC